MSELSAPKKIWLELFQRFLERGIDSLHDLAMLNAITHALVRTVPAEEAQALLPTLARTCAVCHVQGQPDGPRCEAHAFTPSTVVLYFGDEGSVVALCGDCRDRVEELSAKAEAQNPTDPADSPVCDEPLRTVN